MNQHPTIKEKSRKSICSVTPNQNFKQASLMNEFDLSTNSTTPKNENELLGLSKTSSYNTNKYSKTVKNNYIQASTSNFLENYDDIVKSLNQLDNFALKADTEKLTINKNFSFKRKNSDSDKNLPGEFENEIQDNKKRKISYEINPLSFNINRNLEKNEMSTTAEFKGGPIKSLITSKKKETSKSIKKINSDKEIKDMSHIEEIRDFYQYTDDCLAMIPKIEEPSKNDIELLQKSVSFSSEYQNSKIAIFDLDETLIHCDYMNIYDCEIILDIVVPSGGKTKIGVNIRPHILECLEEISKYFVLISFTASHQSYADVILDYLDPFKKIFKYRLYRHHCVKTTLEEEIIYVKDLRIFKNFDLKNIVIIDNSVISFAFQLDNGIPILPFYSNKNDNEFPVLVNYLKHLYTVEDIRIINRQFIKLEYILKCEESDQENSFEEEFSSTSFSKIEDSFSNDQPKDKHEKIRRNIENIVKCYHTQFKSNESNNFK